MDDLSTCTAKWKTISIRLGLPMDKINTIERDGHSAEDCWQDALILWLGQNYNTKKYPLPSWRSLLKIISKIDNTLFKRLAAEHKTGKNYNVVFSPRKTQGMMRGGHTKT